MRKAIMYLLLAIGICVAVLFACGAVIGFAAGFIDGWNEAHPGTTSPTDLMSYSLLLIVVVLGAVLHWVFLHYGFACYSLGHIPVRAWWRILPFLFFVMGGLALLQAVLYNPLAEPDGTVLTESDETIRTYYLWIKNHPLQAFLRGLIIESTANLVIYGAVLRELLEWRHRPELVVPFFAAVVGLLTGLASSPLLIVPAVLTVLVEAWVYACFRSIIPIIIGDMFFWVVTWCLLGADFSNPAFFLQACAFIIPGSIALLKMMDPYKPIN